MEKILKFKYILLTLIILGVSVSSCSDDEPEFIALDTEAIILAELPINTVVLDATNPSNPAVTFNWNEADYQQQTLVNYTLVLSSDEAFTNPIEIITVVSTTAVTISVERLNSAAGTAGLPPFISNTIYAKIVSSLGATNALSKSSNIISFDVEPYFNYTFRDFYLVGNGTSANWENDNNNPPLFRSPQNDDLYTYTGFFTKGGGSFDDGRFKILEFRGQWQPQWGVAAAEGDDDIMSSGDIAGTPVVSGNSATQDSDPGRFGVESDGYYTFTINFSSNTYTINPFSDAGAATFTSMTLQGSGVASDTNFTQSNFDPHLWHINNVILLQAGEIQIVTSTGSTWAGETAFSGVATEGDGTIPVAVQDDYEVWFNDLTGDYIMIPLNL